MFPLYGWYLAISMTKRSNNAFISTIYNRILFLIKYQQWNTKGHAQSNYRYYKYEFLLTLCSITIGISHFCENILIISVFSRKWGKIWTCILLYVVEMHRKRFFLYRFKFVLQKYHDLQLLMQKIVADNW
jgi:hypothetical protein